MGINHTSSGIDSTSGGYVYRTQCLTNKVSDVAREDTDCAHTIEQFINATLMSVSSHDDYDNSGGYHYSYYNHDFNIPQDTIDGVCAPNCRNQYEDIYQQCNDHYVSVAAIVNCFYVQ